MMMESSSLYLWRMGAEFQQEQFKDVSEDQQWSVVTSNLAEMARSRDSERINKSLDYSRDSSAESDHPSQVFEKMILLSFLNIHDLPEMKNEVAAATNSINNGSNEKKKNQKRFYERCLPPTEKLARNEILGGYIFICNNESMKEDLKTQLLCLPLRFSDSVRAITPGLPIFLYNYTTRRLHGIFEAASFGGSNIGESTMFPAQVRIRVRKLCKPLEEAAFSPVLHYYYGFRFRFELSIVQSLALQDLVGILDVVCCISSSSSVAWSNVMIKSILSCFMCSKVFLFLIMGTYLESLLSLISLVINKAHSWILFKHFPNYSFLQSNYREHLKSDQT